MVMTTRLADLRGTTPDAPSLLKRWRFPLLLIALAAILIPLFTANTPLVHAAGGPVVLGGDDATDHGRWDGTQTKNGWRYVKIAYESILSHVVRPGADGSIAMLGSADSTATRNNAGGAAHYAAQEAGIAITFYDGAAAIDQFFVDLAAGNVSPSIIHLAGTGASNDLDASEGTALTNNATAIAGFVNSGGGLFSHGSGSVAYGWLSALLPNAVETQSCQQPSRLSDSGKSLFPGLKSREISSGPCHSTFSGDLGGLAVLAKDSQGRNLLIGSFAATFTDIVLKPDSSEGIIGSTHTLTATVYKNNAAQVGESVPFTVIAGPNQGDAGTLVTDASGTAAFTYTGDGGQGTDHIEASWIDPEDGQEYSSTVIQIWFGPPTLDLARSSDHGISRTDDLTNDATPTFRGTGRAGATVELFEDATSLGTATVRELGDWAVTSSALTEGAHSITAKQTVGSTTTAASGALTVTIDVTPPTGPSSPPDLDPGSDTGASDTDNITADSTPTLTGEAPSNIYVEIISDVDGSLGYAQTNGNGDWSFTPRKSVSTGTHSLTATASDAAGNTTAASSALSVTVSPNCNGVAATIVGTAASETLTGTPGDDVILGLDGDDIINGGGGNDLICGGPGNDTINGQAGNDTIFGGIGEDKIRGGGGRDVLQGGADNDVLRGGRAPDRMNGNGGNDRVLGGKGNDRLAGSSGDDTLAGSVGDDRLDCGPGTDKGRGGPGNDAAFRNCETQKNIEAALP